ncbi:MAG: cyclic nucleotide-binding domain-containing protein, partial [Ruminococcus sp.]|nr:cyclic nucleotide-binding domain-containing protein [Ruminococcus sp.]
MKFNPNCQKPNTCEECTDRCIKDIAFLYGLPEEKQIDILRHSTHKTLRRGDFVFHEGDSVESIVIIKQGQVKLSTYEADGRENIIGIFADNDTIWEGVFSAASSYPYSAVCLTKTYCCYIRRVDVESAISDP